MIPARMRRDSSWSDVKIRNLSSRGLKVEAAGRMARGHYVEIHRDHHVIVGRVVWVRGAQAGIRTQDRIDVPGLIGGRISPGAATVTDADRRRFARPALSAAQQIERSRRWSAMFQFACMMAVIATSALAGCRAVQHALAAPLARVSANL